MHPRAHVCMVTSRAGRLHDRAGAEELVSRVLGPRRGHLGRKREPRAPPAPASVGLCAWPCSRARCFLVLPARVCLLCSVN